MKWARIAVLNLLIAWVVLAWMSYLRWERKPASRPHGLHTSPLANDTAVEAGSLRITLNAIWSENGKTHINYGFEWVEIGEHESPFGFMRPWGVLDIEFWDSAGTPMKQTLADDFACPQFVLHETSLYDGELTFSPPAGARYVAIGFSRPGMMTRKTMLPDWWYRSLCSALGGSRRPPVSKSPGASVKDKVEPDP
jgi:hypothetical protein